MSHDEKLEIAALLDEMGRRYHRGGLSHRLGRGFRRRLGNRANWRKNATICGLARANLKDIDRCWEAVRHAKSPRIQHLHRNLAAAPGHPEPDHGRDGRPHPRNRDPTPATSADNVQWSPMDATRTEWDYLKRVVENRDPRGCHDDQHPRHGGLHGASGKRRFDPPPDRGLRGRRGRGLRHALPQRSRNGRRRTRWRLWRAARGRSRCTINGLGERAGQHGAGRKS